MVENQQRSDIQIRYGTHTTVAAADTVATGLTACLSCSASLGSDADADTAYITAAPSSGNVVIKSWKPTNSSTTTPTATTSTFTKLVYWIAVGY